MAPTDEARGNPAAQEDNNVNPFVSFRRFADERMCDLMNSACDLVSAFSVSSSSSTPSLRDDPIQQAAREQPQNLENSAKAAAKIIGSFRRIQAASEREGLRQELQECPYRPTDQDGPQFDNDPTDQSLAALGTHLPSTILAAPVLGAQLSSVPISYLLYSPYSPVRLELERPFRDYDKHWREAFQDLLAVQNGERASSVCEHDGSLSSVDWVRSMVGLAMCKRDQDKEEEECEPSHYANWSNPGRMVRPMATTYKDSASEEEVLRGHETSEQREDCEEYMTELDLYKHFLGAQGLYPGDESPSGTASASYSDPQFRSVGRSQHEFGSAGTDTKRPDILSTLTTTERTTLPDGTTHTKVVLKKRFSDGREESTETMSTQNPPPKPQYQPPTPAVGDQPDRQKPSVLTNDAKKNAGWFWS